MQNTHFTTKRKICLALGFFDSVHLGHYKITSTICDYAKNHDCDSAIFTFDLRDGNGFKDNGQEIYTLNERIALYKELGIDEIIVYPFNDEVKNTAPLDFLRNLTRDYDVKAFACGNDYTFGKGGRGNTTLLSEFCTANGIDLLVCDEVGWQGEKVSTSLVKNLLAVGDVGGANKLLVRPYHIDGIVVRGRGEGHIFGIPTANVSVSGRKFLPKKGVYGCYFYVDGKRYKAVTNVGEKPTFDDYSVTIEAMLIDFDGDVYGKNVRVEFIKFLRDIKKFCSPQQLSQAIHGDAKWE